MRLRPLLVKSFTTRHPSLVTHHRSLVRVVRFELTTSCAQGTRATKLRHTLKSILYRRPSARRLNGSSILAWAGCGLRRNSDPVNCPFELADLNRRVASGL